MFVAEDVVAELRDGDVGLGTRGWVDCVACGLGGEAVEGEGDEVGDFGGDGEVGGVFGAGVEEEGGD